MLQQSHAPTLQQIFRPINTGSPRQDVYNHLSQLPQLARLDFEEHTVVGNLIVRIEPDLGCASEAEAEAKIVSVTYAERIFGNLADAVEFIRSVKLLAGADARPRDFQIIASHYYKEAKSRPAGEVLKEMALLALHLSSVTASEEERLFGDPVEADVRGESEFIPCQDLSLSERRAEWMRRAAQVLGEAEDTDIFGSELRAASRFRSHVSGFAYDEFKQHLADCEALTDTAEEADALYQSYEATYEQYTEDHAISLHMTDGERVCVVGTLDDDVDETCLPEEARHLAREMHDLYTSGFPVCDRGAVEGVEGVTLSAFVRDHETRERYPVPVIVYGLDTWMDYAIDEIYSERAARTTRHLICVSERMRPRRIVTRDTVIPRTEVIETQKRGVTTRTKQVRHSVSHEKFSVPASRLHEQTGTIEVCPNAEERERTRAVLEVQLARLKEDYHTRGQHVSGVYREMPERIRNATDTAVIAKLKKEAWNHKEAGQLSLKLFTALTTQARARQAALQAEPLREERTHTIVRGAGFTMTKTFSDRPRIFIVAQELMNEARAVGGKTITDFVRRLNALPRQERERVRRALQQENPHLYARVRDGLRTEIERASTKKLGYFRWALYPGNKPEHPVHALTGDDQAAAWALLKSRSSLGAGASSQLVH